MKAEWVPHMTEAGIGPLYSSADGYTIWPLTRQWTRVHVAITHPGGKRACLVFSHRPGEPAPVTPAEWEALLDRIRGGVVPDDIRVPLGGSALGDE